MDELKINENLSPQECEMIKDYWALTEDGIFARKPKLIAQENNITSFQLQKFVVENSEYSISVRGCKRCNTPLRESVTSRSNYLVAKSKANRECKPCEKNRVEEEREFFRKQDERIKQSKLEAAQIQEAQDEMYKSEIQDIGCNYDAVLKFKNERNLSWEDLRTLIYILKYITKDQIYANLFDGDPYNKNIWNSVHRLEKKKLILVRRVPPPNKGVIDFVDPLRLHKSLIEEDFILNSTFDSILRNNHNSTLRFSLQKTENRLNSTQPDYSGTFTLKNEVFLKDEKYIYTGVVCTDGSISFNFEPFSEFLKRTGNGGIESE